MLDLDDGDDLDEQVAYLAYLTKSSDRVLAEQAQDAMDRLAKKFDPSELRGPNGRWVHVGGPGHGGHGSDIEARGRNLTQEAHDTAAEARAALGHGQFDAAIRQAQSANAKKPMTDAEFVKRTEMLEKALDQETVNAHSTSTLHKTNGMWNEERAALHKEIVDHLYAQKAHVPSEGKAVIAGGLGGAGKTTTLKGHAGINPDDWVTLNPDDVKEEMAKRGMVPDVPGHPELSPMERATLIHQESGHITELLANKAYEEKKNVIWDITMGHGGWIKDGLLNDLHQRGYNNVRGVFVDIPVETSVSRAMGRYRSGVDEFRAGKPDALGGRYVPPHIIRAQQAGNSTVNRGVFDELKGLFDDWSLYDNSGTAPVHIASKG